MTADPIMATTGHLGIARPYPVPEVIRPSAVSQLVKGWEPKTALGLIVRRTLPYLPEDLMAELIETIKRSVVIQSELRAKVFRGLGLAQQGLIPWREVVIEPYGIVSQKVVTDTGVGFIVDAFQNLVEMENMKFHGIGTGGTAEAASQTALVTELTTEYNPNSTRATGSTTETSANIYSTVGTNTLDSGTPAITEHGVFAQAATGGGVMFDRSLFAAINLTGANGDGLQTTYNCTFASGG